jgi:hypothetical protein
MTQTTYPSGTKLTVTQYTVMKAIKDRGYSAWTDGIRSRAGGARSRMMDRLVAAGVVAGPPYMITYGGNAAMKTYEKGKRHV